MTRKSGGNTITPLLSDTDREWLKNLSKEIHNGSGFEKRELTTEEWARVTNLINTHELPCEPWPDVYGGIWMRIYSHPEAFGIKPEPIGSIGDENVPGFFNKQTSLDARFAVISTFTHSERNRGLLALYGLEQPQGIEHYEY